jgi:hypothetical protein
VPPSASGGTVREASSPPLAILLSGRVGSAGGVGRRREEGGGREEEARVWGSRGFLLRLVCKVTWWSGPVYMGLSRRIWPAMELHMSFGLCLGFAI